MKKIFDRYNEINDLPEITSGIDQLISECFRYKVFKENPSERFKKNFKTEFEYPYPEYVSDITPKLARNLRIRTKYLKSEEQLALKNSQQRAKRGYSDYDVWSIDTWFMEVVPKMLKAYRKHNDGCPSKLLPSFNPTEEESENAFRKWDEILERMIFLLDEMNEDRCSMKNPYEQEMDRIKKQFRKKYGFYGDKAVNPAVLDEEEESEGSRMYFPSDFPDLYPTYSELRDKWIKSDKEIFEYRDKCRKEFFALFSEYFWDLWY